MAVGKCLIYISSFLLLQTSVLELFFENYLHVQLCPLSAGLEKSS